MADAAAFEWMCARLEQETSLDRLEARGTVRLALKSAGLEARSVTPEQMKVVIEKVMADALSVRGIGDAAGLCAGFSGNLATEASDLASQGAREAPEAIFSRLGGSS